MTYEEALAAHVRKYDWLTGRLRDILLQPNYDNDESLEVKGLREDISAIIKQTFTLKQCHSNAIGILERETKTTCTQIS